MNEDGVLVISEADEAAGYLSVGKLEMEEADQVVSRGLEAKKACSRELDDGRDGGGGGRPPMCSLIR